MTDFGIPLYTSYLYIYSATGVDETQKGWPLIYTPQDEDETSSLLVLPIRTISERASFGLD